MHSLVEDFRLNDSRKGVELYLRGMTFTKIQSTEGKVPSEKARMILDLCLVSWRYLRESHEVSIGN